MLLRCFDERTKQKYSTYKDVTCCEEWLLYDNFYEWLHSQENFDKWYSGNRWCLDKDILVKGNKVYSPKTCCLVPANVNQLFVKGDAVRGELPIGVWKVGNTYYAQCRNTLKGGERERLGGYSTLEQAFNTYKTFKEEIIKQVAQEEYNKSNITKECYDAMMKYKVEMTD